MTITFCYGLDIIYKTFIQISNIYAATFNSKKILLKQLDI